MGEETSTIFKIRLLAKSKSDKQEGFIELWKHEGKIMDQREPFDFLDEIPRKILKKAAIDWPPAV
jgi:hypothetical protein